nr:hypothetical protein [Tanacetum cinerariifolium]
MIITGADNLPHMLDKSMYDSWKSRMKLYIENRENGGMILNSVQHGLLVWPTIVQEDGTKYEELSAIEKLQADCLVVPVFTPGDDPIACLNKAMSFMSAIAALSQAAQTTIPNNAAFQTKDLNAYDYDCDAVSTAKAVLMANLSNYGLDVLSKVPHSEPYHNDMDNQSVYAM